jgi:GNAT superfamily N-acetyltransferase
VCDPSAVHEWGPERVGDLVALTEAALPDERLTADELLACCWEDPGVVLGPDDGSGAASAVVRRAGDHAAAFVKLLVVDPERQRAGIGRSLLRAVEEWAWDGGASDLHLSGSAPAYLWPGVDVRATAMLCLAERMGYEETGAAFDMSLPASYRHPVPHDVELRRTLTEDDAEAVDALVAREWPNWVEEQRRAVEQGTCIAAFDIGSAEAVAFACHSVNRAGWFGPTGTTPSHRHRSIGLALLGEVCADLMVAGFTDVEICWIGPIGFYAAAGGTISRVYRTSRRRKP